MFSEREYGQKGREMADARTIKKICANFFGGFAKLSNGQASKKNRAHKSETNLVQREADQGNKWLLGCDKGAESRSCGALLEGV